MAYDWNFFLQKNQSRPEYLNEAERQELLTVFGRNDRRREFHEELTRTMGRQVERDGSGARPGLDDLRPHGEARALHR